MLMQSQLEKKRNSLVKNWRSNRKMSETSGETMNINDDKIQKKQIAHSVTKQKNEESKMNEEEKNEIEKEEDNENEKKIITLHVEKSSNKE